jgi:hypothetical protein
VSSSGTGINLKGVYRWKLVSMIGDQRQQGSLASSALTLDGKAADLSWTADANGSVTGYELYRTTGTGGLFFFVTAIPGRTTTTFTDNTADRVILANRALQEQGDAPPSGVRFVEIHKERAWYGATSANPNRWWYSDAGRPWSVGVNNNIDVNDAEHQISASVGATGGFDGKLVIWTQNAIFQVSGTGAVIEGVPDLYVRKSAASVGTVGHRSVVRLPEGAVYRDSAGRAQQTSTPTLAFLTRFGDIRVFDGVTDTLVSGTLDKIPLILSGGWNYYHHAIHDEANNIVQWHYTSNGSDWRVLAWNYRIGTWHHWDKQTSRAGLVVQNATGQQLILGGNHVASENGRVRRLFTGKTDQAGASFVGRWVSNTFYGRFGEDTEGREGPLPAAHLMKRWRWVDVIMAAGNSMSGSVKVYRANQAATETPYVTKALNLVASPNRRAVVDKTQLKESTGRFMHDAGIRFSVEDGGSPDEPWVLEGVVLGYNVLAGTKRDRGL